MKLEGEVAELDLVARLVELGREQFTGAIRFENDGVIKILYLKGGDILSASTNDRADSVDEILLRAGKVTREHVKQALAKRKENETLGDALLNLGFITRKELTWGRRLQVIGVIRSIIGWDAGSYTIVADYLPKREEGTIFSLPQIVVELIVTEQDRAKFERELSGGEAVFARAPNFEEAFRKLGLNEEAEEIAGQIDGERSAAEVASASGKDAFNVYKLLHALTVLGLLERRDKAHVEPEVSSDDFSAAGVADAANAWETTADPSFTFEDDAPSLEIPKYDEEITAVAPAADMSLPSWDSAPAPAAPALPPAAPPAADPLPRQAETWGGSEGEVKESAAPLLAPRAAVAPAAPTARTTRPASRLAAQPAKKGKSGLITAAVVVLLMAGAGVAGYKYWTSRPATARPTAPSRAVSQQRGVAPLTAAPAPVPTSTPPPATATATTTVATRTSAAVPAPARTAQTTGGDATRARFDAMARDFAQTASGNFTIQFALVCQTSSLQRAIGVGGGKVWFVPTSYRGQPCYRVFWGSYATREAAAAGSGEIPASIRGVKPVVVAVPRT